MSRLESPPSQGGEQEVGEDANDYKETETRVAKSKKLHCLFQKSELSKFSYFGAKPDMKNCPVPNMTQTVQNQASRTDHKIVSELSFLLSLSFLQS